MPPDPPRPLSNDPDPRRWLEQVDGDEALAWVRQRNDEALAAVDAHALASLQAELLAIYDADDKIPFVSERGGWLYNLWQDAAHPRGLWRRTTLASYASDAPDWDVLLDLDALNAEEGENWVFKGVASLPPDHERVLVSLSRGGADAVVVREFDLATRRFVADGFHLPEAKQSAAWVDDDTLLVARDFGDGGTTSGYPRQVRAWRRGSPLSEAALVYEGERTDVVVSAAVDHTEGFERQFVTRTPSFFTSRLFERRGDALVPVPKPDHAIASVFRDHLLLQPREPWEVDGTTWPAGSLLATDYAAWMRGEGTLTALFTPTDSASLADHGFTAHHVYLCILDDVRSRVEVATPGPDGWDTEPMEGVPELGTVWVSAVDRQVGDELWLRTMGYLTPTELWRHDLADGSRQRLKASPAWFDAAPFEVTQHFATSADGTRVPYFQIGPRGGSEEPLPTLLYGYGGFEVSQLPFYSGTVGRGWLRRGGVYVVANIRGGGEYGPRWHQAALRDQRPRAFEDFVAVARDLVARGVTTRRQLGVRGGSNGGLLVGNIYTQYPEDVGAVACSVPLLDMRRYHQLLAGASWVGEYGDPDDPEQWAYLQTFSPYHNLDPAIDYPPILFTTSTRDDRVHPGHARKMAHAVAELGAPVAYYENIEGGHAGAADNEQIARLMALQLQWLWEQLAG